MQAISNLRVWVVTAEDDQGFSIINKFFFNSENINNINN